MKTLRDYGFINYAEAIEERLAVIEKNLIAKQRYESVLAELEKDLVLSASATKYLECCELIVKLEKWIDYFEKEHDLPLDVVASTFARIKKAVAVLQFECENWLRKVQSIPEYISANLYGRIEKAKMLVEGRLHSSRVGQLLAMYDGLTEREKQMFKQMLNKR